MLEPSINEAADEQHLFLSVRYPLLDRLTLFYEVDGVVSHLELGDLLPFEQRMIKTNEFVFPVTLEPGVPLDLYLRVESESALSVPLYLHSENAFIESQQWRDGLNGLYVGVALGLCVYNLFLWLGVRKRLYGIYVVAIINLILFNSTLAGYGFRLWPEAIAFQQISIYFFSITAGVSVCFFGMAFLKTKKRDPKMHKILRVSVTAFILTIPLIMVLPGILAAKINSLVMIVGVSLLFIAAVRSTLSGFSPAIYYLIGQGAVLASVIFVVLSSQGLISYFYLSPEVMKASLAFELIFFSIALTSLVNNERLLREKAQVAAVDAKQALLESQVRINQELDDLVRERTEALEKANQRLEELNNSDELTGLGNRRYLNHALPNEFNTAYRNRTSLAVLMCDIDYFKKLNDDYGHQVGDLCLSEVGRVLHDSLRRPPDLCFRYGGEEFLALLPNTDLQGAKLVAENIRKKIESMVINAPSGDIRITISIGAYAEIPENRDAHEQLMKTADENLYKAKERGRNCVV